jgi:hypothetical protein
LARLFLALFLAPVRAGALTFAVLRAVLRFALRAVLRAVLRFALRALEIRLSTSGRRSAISDTRGSSCMIDSFWYRRILGPPFHERSDRAYGSPTVVNG